MVATRRVRIRPVTADDYLPLLELEAAPDVLHTWRLRGGVPTDFAAYETGLWNAVSDQRILERVDGTLLGLAQMYNLDARLGTAWFSMIAVPSVRGTGAVLESVGLFLRRCFVTWDLRRLYFTALAPNFATFASVASRSGYAVYGTMKDRAFLEGAPVDVVYGGIDAEPWLAHYEPILRRLTRPSVP
jgi:RimJ/RimL family protein N-acetyltransferase